MDSLVLGEAMIDSEARPGGGAEEALRLRACERGEREAQEWLFETYRDKVYRTAFHLCRDPSEAADVTQDVFVKVFTRLGQFRQESSFATWLHRVVVNTFLDRHKRERRLVSLEQAGLEDSRTAPPGQERRLEQAERAERVSRALGRIREEFRVTIVLRFASELSYEEIAETLGVSAGTVASRLSRGLRDLGRELRRPE